MKETMQKRGQEWLENLLNKMGLTTAVKVEVIEGWSGQETSWLMIDPSPLNESQIEQLVGTGGESLDAIQYLINAILNLGQDREEQGSFTVELNGYRHQRQQEVQKMAEVAAYTVRQTAIAYEMKALSSAERREVHQFLQSHEDLETESVGKEPHRCLIVRVRSQLTE
ncbi:MAG: RNA-binding protein [Roseofilum sp. Belize BBD 4]|uniref:Jag family protein n=2 Tax=unclassified Roseofilum TaxID=2620099 RepID=UPI000E9A1CEE|nr:R3H domain-containing nucleic acid-binding protein [Roseofilum sp. Belize BBD 4]MBP0007229.1 RNA-binding protein [Roseofilum sp. Belize Diploria]MBP0031872.1 RNA-binding protein [Roseofilum sp. Belize BBD 4]HBQ97671.1 RNA-binding protein [Cyanobacteria bacterium UBA11691]